MTLASFEPAELRRFTRAFEDFFYQDDPESMTSYYTENAQLMADGIQPVHGHGAIGRFWREAIARASAAGARRTIHLHESHSSGELGYALCTVTVQMPPDPDVTAWDATIWQREPGGGWRIAVDISTSLPPAS
jgi:ketosteroid isomerase-like protein